jgi:hypothetical protein
MNQMSNFEDMASGYVLEVLPNWHERSFILEGIQGKNTGTETTFILHFSLNVCLLLKTKGPVWVNFFHFYPINIPIIKLL